ncbi:SDR family NAD(P)-dependent oxidoreductase, partial [Shewanella surugensis]
MIKSILITGCSSGIGRFCAEQLHESGFKVIASCRKLEDVAA